jgi:hypothetical protein
VAAALVAAGCPPWRVPAGLALAVALAAILRPEPLP